MNKKLIILLIVLLNTVLVKAQDDRIKFGAYARALQQNNQLGGEDTLNVDRTSSGHVLVDLGVNINPDKKTEIQAIVRLKSDLGGFFGAGTQAVLRQAYLRGIIGKVVNYQVGDLYLQLSPYTFYNNYSEGQVNEARIFSDIRRDYTNYENLSHRGNYWWQQGFQSDFSLEFKETFIEKIRFDGFFLRNRTTDFFSIPSAFHAGGRVLITQGPKFKLAGNYVNLFDVGATVGSDQGVRNPVTSAEAELKLWDNSNSALVVSHETGYSSLVFKNDTAKTKTDIATETKVALSIKSLNLTVSASGFYVGPEFFSSAAQTKRVDFTSTPVTFPIYGNDPFNPFTRNVTLFDLVRDPAVYNPAITYQLMAYDPTLNNTMPYGKATPNRQGGALGVMYKDSLEKIVADVDFIYAMDASGAGSQEKRNFMVVEAELTAGINKFIGFKKRLNLTAGVRYENTSRGGNALETVDLSSNLIDLGLEVEVFKKFDVLGGVKMLMAEGNEFIAVRDGYNNVINYVATGNMDISQNLLAFGVKYRFSENTYLTVQDHIFNYKNNTVSALDYSINQVWLMFNMNF